MKGLLRHLLFAAALLLPVSGFAENLSARLPSYDPASTQWHLRCAVGTATKTLVGSAAPGSPILFAMGAPAAPAIPYAPWPRPTELHKPWQEGELWRPRFIC